MKKELIINLLIMLLINGNCLAQSVAYGKQITLLTAVIVTKTSVTIEADFVQMLTGNAAVKAAKRTGEAEFEIKKGDTTWFVPNDYFVSNEHTKIRKLTLSANAQIFLIKEGTSFLAKSSAAKLKKSFAGKLFSLTVLNNTVIVISEIYTP